MFHHDEVVSYFTRIINKIICSPYIYNTHTHNVNEGTRTMTQTKTQLAAAQHASMYAYACVLLHTSTHIGIISKHTYTI